jgi:hypothetical protein
MAGARLPGPFAPTVEEAKALSNRKDLPLYIRA